MDSEFSGALSECLAVERWHEVRDDRAASAGSWHADGGVNAAVTVDGHGRETEGGAKRSRPRYRLLLRAPFAVDLLTRFIWRGAILTVLGVERDPLLRDRQSVRVEARGGGVGA